MGDTHFMERDLMTSLVDWKDSPFRMPLILKGARQVGKTAILKEFGRRFYSNTAYVSLERISADIPSEYAQFFEETIDPQRIIANLSLALETPIEPGATLLILDEIQDCPAAIKALKYFCEDMPSLHVACAGSLLGVALASEESFPVGKVDFLALYPLSFLEYLNAIDEPALRTYVEGIEGFHPIPDLFANRLSDALRSYFVVGGMPGAVQRWILTHDIVQVDMVLSGLIDSYEHDFAKHGGAKLFSKLLNIWHSLPMQLARENKRFSYSSVKESARSREYADAIMWLEAAGLIYRVSRSSKPGIPMSAYDEKAFKLYLLDVGVLRRLSQLAPSAFTQSDALFTEFKGAFAENYALQALVPQLDVMPRYWTNDKPPHEIDFLMQIENEIVPCEVKTGTNVKSPSLRYYASKYGTNGLRVRFSLRNLAMDDNMLNLPLYLADISVKAIRLAKTLPLCR